MLLGLKRRLVYMAINKLYRGTNEKHWEKKRNLLNWLGHEIGEGTKIVGPIHIYGNLTVGSDCWIGTDFIVHGLGRVIIGDRCDIAPEVRFLTGSHKIGDEHRRAGKGISHTIVIEEGCWIGARTTLVGDITIHKSTIIGACSFVNKNVQSNVVAAGIPAKIIKDLDDARIKSL